MADSARQSDSTNTPPPDSFHSLRSGDNRQMLHPASSVRTVPPSIHSIPKDVLSSIPSATWIIGTYSDGSSGMAVVGHYMYHRGVEQMLRRNT